MDGVRVCEDVVRGFPIRVLIGGAEARNPEGCRISKRSTEIGGGCPIPRCSCERSNDRGGIVAEKALGQCHVIRPALHVVAGREEVGHLQTGPLTQSDEVDGLAPRCPFLSTYGNACLEWLATAFPFAEGPRVEIRLPPVRSLSQ